MVPQPNHVIDHTPEYEDFIIKLREYHEKRGTNFEPEPKVGHVHVDLLKLFRLINEHGGYDKVSDEKLAWRNMVNTLGLYSSNEASAAYSLKVAYYKNLAAYEISTIHNKEPPPPEILEHISAKGGSLLTRTLENYGHKIIRNAGSLGGDAADRSGDDGTPARDRRADDTPGSGRASRGRREAPAQRVIFQPDTGPSRQPRHASGQHAHSNAQTPTSHAQSHAPSPHAPPHGHVQMGQHIPTPPQHHPRGASAMYNAPPGSENYSAAVQAYEPRGPVPIHLRPVETPGNSPAEFARRQRLLRLQALGLAPGQIARPPPVPGFDGPNIYVRCLAALRSGIPAEEAFALFHLVKISYERGDKYKFESFFGLAEGLVEKTLQVGGLFYHVNWAISYDPDSDETDLGELDGVNGTMDILERISQLRLREVPDSVQSAAFTDQLVLIIEAAHTIRNMVLLPENAIYMADFPPLKDLLCIVLHLPANECVVELKHCALDIAEQLTPYLVLDADDPFYQTLLRQLDSPDRGIILTALRAIGRISMNLAETNRLGKVPLAVLQNIMNWLLLNDDELMDACLDFLYQYTAVVSNVENLVRSVSAENLVSHLVRLLSHGAKRVHREQILEAERKVSAGDDVLRVPADLLERLVNTDEPDRCYTWLRCFFEEDPDASITQIAIWQAYQSAFQQIVQAHQKSMLGAADFIRNVTHVYHSASAQIQREQTDAGEVQKFIIKGIRARERPISPEGREFFRCQWAVPAPNRPNQRCGQFFSSAEKMFGHILKKHLAQSPGEDGRFGNGVQERQCLWAECRKFRKPTAMRLANLMTHVKTHLITAQKQAQTSHANGDATPVAGGATNKRARRSYIVPAKTISLTYEETLTTRDEKNPNAPPQAAGIPLSAVLVLRNIARNVVKTDAEEELLKRHERGGEAGGWNERCFRPMLPRLYEIMTENRVMAPYITSLLQLISDD